MGDGQSPGSCDKHVYGLTITDGKQAWNDTTGQSITDSRAVEEGHLVIGTDPSDDRILCFGAK